MTNLPAQHPSLSLHLTDSTLTPLITSSSSPTHLNSLTSLASTALTSHAAVSASSSASPSASWSSTRTAAPSSSRASSIRRRSSKAGESRPGTSSRESTSTRASTSKVTGDEDEGKPPRLVGVVVAGSADQTKEARRAAARLERVGREFQREWATEGVRYDGDEAGSVNEH